MPAFQVQSTLSLVPRVSSTWTLVQLNVHFHLYPSLLTRPFHCLAWFCMRLKRTSLTWYQVLVDTDGVGRISASIAVELDHSLHNVCVCTCLLLCMCACYCVYVCLLLLLCVAVQFRGENFRKYLQNLKFSKVFSFVHGKVRVPNSGRVLIWDTYSFSLVFQAALSSVIQFLAHAQSTTTATSTSIFQCASSAHFINTSSLASLT